MGPIDQMAYWHQFAIGGGLFATLTLLLMLPKKSEQPLKVPVQRERRETRDFKRES